MTHEFRSKQIELPELDAFLREYAALCEKHGMQFKADEYGYDGGCYVTLAAYEADPIPYLNLDYADRAIPCFQRANEEVEAAYVAESRAAAKAEAKARPIRERELYEALKAKYG